MQPEFDTLSELKTSAQRHALSFNLLVAGRPKVGKTTLINSLFDYDFDDLECKSNDVGLVAKEFRPYNNEFNMRLTIIEAKGLGTQADGTKTYEPILDYIIEQYNQYLANEIEARVSLCDDSADTRVHCCIYLISPTGLKPLDILTMKQLGQYVSLIPVIAQSEFLVESTKQKLKENIRHQIDMYGIRVYPTDDLPFAVTGGNEIITEKGKRERVRVHPTGLVHIEKHSEISKLRDLVLRGMRTLKERTNEVNYQEIRRLHIQDAKSFKLCLEENESRVDSLMGKVH